jgi:hypothetical protein
MANLIRLKQIESSSAIQTAAIVGADTASVINNVVSESAASILSASIINVVVNNIAAVFPDGVISGSSQLDGSTIKNLTISTENADRYSLVVSGAMAVVDATNLSGTDDFENDVIVPGQIYLVTGSVPPTDPYVSGSSQSNIIDQGEW